MIWLLAGLFDVDRKLYMAIWDAALWFAGIHRV
jgi:hypothetical protein